MEVLIPEKLKELANPKTCQQRWGKEMAKIIAKRLDQLYAAVTLADLRYAPGKWHELGGNRKGQIAAHLKMPFGVIIEPKGDPDDFLENDQLRWEKVTAVYVKSIENYHPKK